MRVLTLTPALPTDDRPGSMAPVARQIESLRNIGIDVELLEILGLPVLKYAQSAPASLRLAKHVDLVHAHYGYCGWLARMQSAHPIVVSFMGDDILGTPRADGSMDWFSRVVVPANRRLARHVSAVIVKSPEMASLVAPASAHVIPNGVDLDLFKPLNRQRVRRELGWDDDALFVLFPGNPENPRKGFALAEASTRVAESILEQPVCLKVLWNVPPEQVVSYMNACNAMVMASLSEGSPNVVKEALACDLPVVGVPVGDVESLIGDVTGCYVSERDPDQLGGFLAEVLRERAPVPGNEAIRRKELDLISVARRIAQIYDQVLEDA